MKSVVQKGMKNPLLLIREGDLKQIIYYFGSVLQTLIVHVDFLTPTIVDLILSRIVIRPPKDSK